MIKEIFILIFLYQHSNAGIGDGVSGTLKAQDEDNSSQLSGVVPRRPQLQMQLGGELHHFQNLCRQYQ